MAEKTSLRLACERYAECVGSCPYDIHDLYEPWEESCYEKCSANINYAECWERYFIQQAEKGHLMDSKKDPIEKLREWLDYKVNRFDPYRNTIELNTGAQPDELYDFVDEIEAAYVPRELLKSKESRVRELENNIDNANGARRHWKAKTEVVLRELGELRSDVESHYMKLPVDADGIPIRPGDKMQMALGESAEVVAVGSKRWFYDQSCLVDDGEDYDWGWAENSRHVNPDTVESIIAEAMSFACEPEAPYSKSSKYVQMYAERIRKAVEC